MKTRTGDQFVLLPKQIRRMFQSRRKMVSTGLNEYNKNIDYRQGENKLYQSVIGQLL